MIGTEQNIKRMAKATVKTAVAVEHDLSVYFFEEDLIILANILLNFN